MKLLAITMIVLLVSGCGGILPPNIIVHEEELTNVVMRATVINVGHRAAYNILATFQILDGDEVVFELEQARSLILAGSIAKISFQHNFGEDVFDYETNVTVTWEATYK